MSLAEHLDGYGLAVRDSVAREPMMHNLLRSRRRQGYDVHVEVNGNAAVFFYLHEEGTDHAERTPARIARAFPARSGATVDVERALLEAPATELVLSRERAGVYRVASRKGVAAFEVQGRRARYRVLEGLGPLGFTASPAARPLLDGGLHPLNAWFRGSAGGTCPDPLNQIAGLLERRRAPDLVVSAAPGWEPWTEGQAGLHGSLRREHMRVPLLLAGPGVPVRTLARGRTVDVFPTLCEILGLEVPPGQEGVAMPWRPAGKQARRKAGFAALHAE